MTPTIDKVKTGQQIRLLMEKRGITVRDVKNALSLACVQSVYHWLDGQSMPTLDNLYALSELLKVPMDMLVCGNRRYDPKYDQDSLASLGAGFGSALADNFQSESLRNLAERMSDVKMTSDIPAGAERLFRYYRLIQDCMAA